MSYLLVCLISNEMGEENIIKWLALTNQQFEIVKIIFRLQKKSKAASPKDIINEYKAITGVTLQRSNFFTQIKTLLEKGVITREEKADYRVNFNAIKNALSDTRNKLLDEINEFENVASETESYFREISAERTKATAEYYPWKGTFELLASYVKSAKSYSLTSRFPYLPYTHNLLRELGTGADRVVDILWERAIREKSMDLTYLTQLDIAQPYYEYLELRNEPEIAYTECKLTINRLEDIIGSSEKLKMFYVKNPYGLDVLIPETEKEDTIFLMIRDEKLRPSGTVHVISEPVTSVVKRMFDQVCKNAEELKGDERTKELLDGCREQLEKLHAKNKKK